MSLIQINKKRISREIPGLKKRFKSVTQYDDENGMLTVQINNHFKFVIPESYPFKKPKLFVKNLEYYKLLQNGSEYFLYELRKKNIYCLCCSSILCRWVPSYTLEKILNEYYENKKISISIYKKRYVRPICYTYNIYCEELIEIIKSYL